MLNMIEIIKSIVLRLLENEQIGNDSLIYTMNKHVMRQRQ